jgi:hypothetical protein
MGVQTMQCGKRLLLGSMRPFSNSGSGLPIATDGSEVASEKSPLLGSAIKFPFSSIQFSQVVHFVCLETDDASEVPWRTTSEASKGEKCSLISFDTGCTHLFPLGRSMVGQTTSYNPAQ